MEKKKGWSDIGICKQKIEGGEGNSEYIMEGKKER